MKRMLNNWIITLIIFFQVAPAFSGVIPVSFFRIESFTSKYLTVAFSLVLIIINVKNIHVLIVNSTRILNFFVFVTLVYSIILMIYSDRKYGETFSQSVTAGHQFFVLLFFIGLQISLLTLKDQLYLLKLIWRLALVGALIFSVQAFMYNRGIDIVNLSAGVVRTRNSSLFGFPRIVGLGDFVSLAVLVSLVLQHFSGAWFGKYFASSLLFVAYIIFIEQTRLYMIIDSVLVIMFILSVVYNKNRLCFFASLIPLTIAGIVAVFPLLNSFLHGVRSVSYSVRVEAIAYYHSKMPAHSVFGLGFPNESVNPYALHGDLLTILGYQYYLDDLGIIGNFFQLGRGIVLILIPFILGIYKQWYRKIDLVSCLVVGYIFLTMISLSLFNAQRITVLVILLYLLSMKHENVSGNEV